jgi:malate dehydrogenase (oxaloacetate-decarboxylating)
MTAAPSVSNSITVRLELPARATAVSELTTAIERSGGLVTGLDVTASGHQRLRVDVTAAARDTGHVDEIVAAMRAVHGVEIGKISDRTFLAHLGGKLTIESKVPIRNRDDLSLIYTPGVARVCMAIAENPEDARRLTIKRNTVAVVTDGTAVLGLGNIGPLAALPVMEGKAALFKRFAGIDAFPICLDTQDVDEIVAAVKAIAPVFAGINLEDISAPRCFEVEARLREELDIPVFHDDQHGTAIVVLAALRNALRVVGKDLTRVRVVMSGAGAAGTAILKLLLKAGVTDVVVADYHGVVHGGRPDISDAGETNLGWIAAHTNQGGVTGSLKEAVAGADVFIGVSAPDVLTGDDIATMNDDAIVFALANPDPEVDPAEAAKHAAVVATGRSDFANQINNVLVFPGVFRGLLDAATNTVSDDVLLAAANALSEVVTEDQLNPAYIIPSVFNPDVAKVVAAAVEAAARSAAPGAAATVAADASRSHTGAPEEGAQAAAVVPPAGAPVPVSTAGPLGG